MTYNYVIVKFKRVFLPVVHLQRFYRTTFTFGLAGRGADENSNSTMPSRECKILSPNWGNIDKRQRLVEAETESCLLRYPQGVPPHARHCWFPFWHPRLLAMSTSPSPPIFNTHSGTRPTYRLSSRREVGDPFWERGWNGRDANVL